jgi:hypothetical protein
MYYPGWVHYFFHTAKVLVKSSFGTAIIIGDVEGKIPGLPVMGRGAFLIKRGLFYPI